MEFYSMTKPTKKQITKWKANRKKWVEALRSKKYTQGEGQLLDDYNHYCCLGVLCDVIGMKPHKKNEGVFFGNDYQLAPYTACQAVGLKDQHGTYKRRDYNSYSADCLTSNNDDSMSFEKIADIIESEPEGLFRDYD